MLPRRPRCRTEPEPEGGLAYLSIKVARQRETARPTPGCPGGGHRLSAKILLPHGMKAATRETQVAELQDGRPRSHATPGIHAVAGEPDSRWREAARRLPGLRLSN